MADATARSIWHGPPALSGRVAPDH